MTTQQSNNEHKKSKRQLKRERNNKMMITQSQNSITVPLYSGQYVDELKARIIVLETENKSLRNELEIYKKFENRVYDLGNENKKLKDQVNSLETENKDLKDKFNTLETENKSLKDKINILEEENKLLKDRVKSLEEENKSLKNEIKILNDKIEHLEDKEFRREQIMLVGELINIFEKKVINDIYSDLDKKIKGRKNFIDLLNDNDRKLKFDNLIELKNKISIDDFNECLKDFKSGRNYISLENVISTYQKMIFII